MGHAVLLGVGVAVLLVLLVLGVGQAVLLGVVGPAVLLVRDAVLLLVGVGQAVRLVVASVLNGRLQDALWAILGRSPFTILGRCSGCIVGHIRKVPIYHIGQVLRMHCGPPSYGEWRTGATLIWRTGDRRDPHMAPPQARSIPLRVAGLPRCVPQAVWDPIYHIRKVP